MQIGIVSLSLPAGQCPCHNLEEVRQAITRTLTLKGWVPKDSATRITEEGIGVYRLTTIEGDFVIEFEDFGFETGDRTVYMFTLSDSPTELPTSN